MPKPQSDLPTVADIRAAAARIDGEAVRTPLLASRALSDRLGGRILLKCETLQRTGSFKFRGAYNALAALAPEVRAKGVVAMSSGNHAQGVAEAARIFGVAATIVMPADAPAVKRAGVTGRGARIVDYDRASEDREAVAAALLTAEGGTLVHPYNDPRVIAGQGTIGLEIAEDAESLGIQAGRRAHPLRRRRAGGRNLHGAPLPLSRHRDLHRRAQGFRRLRPLAGRRHDPFQPLVAGSVCDALLAPSPGAIGFALNQKNFTDAFAVSDDEVLAAVAFAFRELKLIVEPGGAVALAALLAGRFDCAERTVIAVLSGANIDEAMLARALATPTASM